MKRFAELAWLARWSWKIAVLLVVGLLALALRGVVGRYLLPPLARAWQQIAFGLGLLWRSQDKALIWESFVLVLALAALAGLLGLRQRAGRPRVSRPPQPLGRVRAWRDQLASLDKGPYFRWRLAQRLRAMLLAREAFRHGVDETEARRMLRAGQLELPQAIRAYLLAAESQRFEEVGGAMDPLGLSPEVIVEFLESED